VAIDPASPARAELVALLVHHGIERAHANAWDDAIVDYRKALEVDPDSAAASYDLSLALEQRGDHEAAWAAVEKSLAIQPTRRAQIHLAIVLDSLGRRRQARDALAKARSMPADD